MRTIDPKFTKVVLGASREAFLDFMEDRDCFVELPPHNDKIGMSTKDFDEISYRIFLEGLKYVRDKKTINKITQEIGKKILVYFKDAVCEPDFFHLRGVQLATSEEGCKLDKFLLTGDPDDMESWQSDLEKLVKCLIHVGYLEDGKIIWKDKKEFLYQMKDPAILPSATKLFNKYGVAQHYFSRTIEALFATYQIEAHENPDFNPNKYKKNLVVEHWNIEKLI